MGVTRREVLSAMAMGLAAASAAKLLSGGESAGGRKPGKAGPGKKEAKKLPPLARRGIHVMAGGPASMPALEQLIGELAPTLGLNWVILEVGDGFAYQSHPECAGTDALTKQDARKLAGLARKRGITLVPEYNSLGHQSWRESTGALLRAHPEFNEAPDMDPTAAGFYCMSWCPNHPALYPIVFDLYDELLDAFQAKAFHVGMDEVFILGQCPRCKGTPNSQLFAKAVKDLHAHLVDKRKVEMLMWGDRLLNDADMHYGSWDASANDTWQAVDLVPKDIVMCDWHYGLDSPDFPSVQFFQGKGFRVWPAGFNDADAVRRFIEVARKEATPRMVGYLATTWTDVTRVVAGLAGQPYQERRQEITRVVTSVKLGAALARGEDIPAAQSAGA